jgi:hypothetical protein
MKNVQPPGLDPGFSCTFFFTRRVRLKWTPFSVSNCDKSSGQGEVVSHDEF